MAGKSNSKEESNLLKPAASIPKYPFEQWNSYPLLFCYHPCWVMSLYRDRVFTRHSCLPLVGPVPLQPTLPLPNTPFNLLTVPWIWTETFPLWWFPLSLPITRPFRLKKCWPPSLNRPSSFPFKSPLQLKCPPVRLPLSTLFPQLKRLLPCLHSQAPPLRLLLQWFNSPQSLTQWTSLQLSFLPASLLSISPHWVNPFTVHPSLDSPLLDRWLLF